MHYDVIVIGAGIVGAATARELSRRFPDRRLLLLDKEARPGVHQTGHSSGVIHAGVYYAPGSLKARFCREGGARLKRYCRERGIDVKQCGKLIVATDRGEQRRMAALRQRCEQNGVRTTELDRQALREREPYIEGVAALAVADSAVVDFPAVCRALVEDFRGAGGELALGAEVLAIREERGGVSVETTRGHYRGAYLVCCGGLMADRLARLAGLDCDYRIVPFRGEFFRLADHWRERIGRLIYPVPDPALPFLGVHLTLTPGGDVIAGPNAVLGWRREAYDGTGLSLRDTGELLRFPGFWRLLARHWRHGLSEQLDSLQKKRYLQRLQRYCPTLSMADLQPWPAGVRAQAVDRRGQLLQDFLLLRGARSLHVINAPSPAATSALSIAADIVSGMQRNNLP